MYRVAIWLIITEQISGGKQSYIGTKFLNTIKIKLVLFQDSFKLQFMLIIIQGKSLGKIPTKYNIKNNKVI